MKAQLKFTPLLRGKNSSGKHYVYIKVYVNRTDYSFFSTGLEIEKKQLRNGQVVGNVNAYEINNAINKALRSLGEIVTNQIAQGAKITSKGIIHSYENGAISKPVNKITFNTYFRDKIDELEGIEKSDTLRDKRQTLAVLDGFNSELGFKDINPEVMYDFWNYLKRKPYKEATCYKHKKNITWAINRAIASRLVDPLINPWQGMVIKRPEGNREALTIDELSHMEALSYEDQLQQKYLDAFLFSCYTGMRFCDIQKLAKEHIVEEEGENYIRMTYAKTMDSSGAKVSLNIDKLFEGKPLQIIRKYPVLGTGEGRIFTSIFNARANEELKVFANEAKIKKNLTFHMGRHTFGTHLARVLKDPYTLMNFMGLRKLDTAMIYIHADRDIMNDKIDSINWNPVRRVPKT